MPSFRDPEAFSDKEDSAIVAEAKKIIPDAVSYVYTEVEHWLAL